MQAQTSAALQHDDGANAPTTLKHNIVVDHPVQALQRAQSQSGDNAKRALQAATYGSAFCLRRMMQENVLSSFHRLPGLPSSGVALDILNRRDADLDFDDYLNLPEESPDGGPVDTLGTGHEAIEASLGISMNRKL